MAFFNYKNDMDTKTGPDNLFELDPETLAEVAGGAGQTRDYNGQDYDTYRYWRDQNGVMREIR